MQIISSQLLLQWEPARPIKGEQNLQASFLSPHLYARGAATILAPVNRAEGWNKTI